MFKLSRKLLKDAVFGLFRKLRKEEREAAAFKFVLIAVAITVVIIVVMNVMGTSLKDLF